MCQFRGLSIQYILLTVVSISMLDYEPTKSCLCDYEINSMNAAEESDQFYEMNHTEEYQRCFYSYSQPYSRSINSEKTPLTLF